MSVDISRETRDNVVLLPGTTSSVTLTLSGTEYTFSVPASTKKIGFQLRTQAYDLKYAWASGGVFITIPAGSPGFFLNDVNATKEGATLYLKCDDAAGQIVDIDYYI